MDNNHSEGELRRIAVGRKAWLFVGSDDHGTSAGHLFSLIASARLHRVDPEEYLRDLFRILGQWPRDRYLELAPKYWAATRARLNPVELANEVGTITIPSPPVWWRRRTAIASQLPASRSSDRNDSCRRTTGLP